MHTIRRYIPGPGEPSQDKWLVVVPEGAPSAGFRQQYRVVATCITAHWAALACSFLNGGEGPSAYSDEIMWVGV